MDPMSSPNPIAPVNQNRRRTRRRIIRAGLAVLSAGALALTVAAGSATMAVNKLQDNVEQVDISQQVGPRPVDYGEMATGPLNILLMGSDKRTGKGNTGYGYFDGERSDTAMLLHLYPDRRSAVIVSIPRDTVTDIPECVDRDGNTVPASVGRFNGAYTIGGPGCTIKTLERMSGLRINHFVVLDFNGFKRSVSALGGVEVCLNNPIDDPSSDIHLPAGRTRISGDVALDFVRVRHGIGDGSDIGRIARQQLFLTSMIKEVTSSGLMTDPVRLWNVLDETTKSIKTDKTMADPRELIALAGSLGYIKPGDINFVTLPWYSNNDGATVSEDKALSAPMWKAIRHEQAWPPPPSKGVDGERLTVKPSEITVEVRNGTGTSGQATQAAKDLSEQGFTAWANKVIGTRTTTRISYNPAQLEAARTVQAALPGSHLHEDPELGTELVVRLGADYSGVAELNVRPPKVERDLTPTDGTKDDGITNAGDDICTA
jgi:LCP family protein required for cell wall assembly